MSLTLHRASLGVLFLLGSVSGLLAASCGGGGDTTGASSSSSGGKGGGDAGSDLPPAICNAGTKWTPGTAIFKETTTSWKLDGVIGVRLSAVDVDADGWPDLMVRYDSVVGDDFKPMGKRFSWLLRNTQDKHFEDVTQKSGIRQNRTATDATIGRPGTLFAFGDVDNDGDLDVYTGLINDPMKPETETSELLLNNGDGTFKLGPDASPIRVKKPVYDAPLGASFVDFDRDGKLDLWVVENTVNGNPVQDRLYKGDGAGNFADVTFSLGLKTKSWGANTADLNLALGHSIGWAALACDLNDDGNPELLAASYGRAPNHLWQNKGKDGGYSFINQSIASGYAFDDDQDWHDNESARCWCKLHPTDMGCMGVPAPKYIQCLTDADAFRWNHPTDQNPYRLGGNSGGTQCADVNNDGHMDLVTSEIVHWDVGKSSDSSELMLNTGSADVKLTRPGNDKTGLARTYKEISWNEGIMSGSVFDFDNDGWPDIYLGNSDYPGDHGLLYHQDTPAHFEEVPLAQGIDHHRSHGSAIADFDHDGDLDIVVGHSTARCNQDPKDDSECYHTEGNACTVATQMTDCPAGDACLLNGKCGHFVPQIRFFENVMPAGNFVELSLTGGAAANRAAIGARVTVKAGEVTQTQEIGGGHGQNGIQDDLSLHFGLGAACEADVTIRWPDAELATQSFKLPAGYRFTVTQGEAPKAVLHPKK